jgi:hypothetical protein
VHVDAEANEFLIIVEDAVEVLQEDVSKDIDTTIGLVERILSDSKLADFTLMQVGFRAHLKSHFTDQE